MLQLYAYTQQKFQLKMNLNMDSILVNQVEIFAFHIGNNKNRIRIEMIISQCDDKFDVYHIDTNIQNASDRT